MTNRGIFRASTAWAVLAVFLALGGCAAPKYSMTLDVYGINGDVEKVWPPAPEVPRYMYIGELVGEPNFAKDSGGGGFRKALEVIAGVIAGKSGPELLQRPQAGVVDAEGNIYITDVSRQAVCVFHQEKGFLVWDMISRMGRFVSPIGVAIGRDGEILVTDSELGVVVRLDREGKPLGIFGRKELTRPTGIVADPEKGFVYVADTHAHDIKVFDYDGGLVGTIGKRGDEKGSLNFPIHLAFSKGRIYVTDTLNARVQVFSEDGEFITTFGSRGLYKGQFTRPKGIALDSDGNIYVVESYYDHLLIYDNQGRFLLPMGGAGSDPGKFYLPAGVWVDEHDRVFVADMFNRRVVVFQYLGGS
ncbi:MAG: 6-bladed beta-propeller [Candidatus Nitrospinota bacterium M3_3B_026]